MLKMMYDKQRTTNDGGFTLIEILVSVAIFAVVMVIALGALLAMSESDRKAQTLKSVINNLNFSLDSMSRTIRTGQNYHCNADVTSPSLTLPRECPGSAAGSIAFLSANNQTVIYRYETTNASMCGQLTGTVGCITRSTDGGATYAAITASEVVVSSLQFYVTGATNASLQPKVTMLLQGQVQVSGTQTSTFNVETSATQRLYDQ